MAWWSKKHEEPQQTVPHHTSVSTLPVSSPPAVPVISAPAGTVSLVKGKTISLTKATTPGGDFWTLIARWTERDYDLYALVEYQDGHVEVVSCFGTLQRPKDFSLSTKDGAVKHVTGDKVAKPGQPDEPWEAIQVQFNDNIRCVVPVVYSAKNSGTGSFAQYGVDTFVLQGRYERVPPSAPHSVVVLAENANVDRNVYTYVPVVIHNDPAGPRLDPVDFYSRRNSENRPTVHHGVVTMDNGPENGNKA